MKFVKKLGQNFLVNRAALKKIAKALEIKRGETVIEIGAGSGSLTREILKITDKVIAIEKDPRLVRELNFQFPIPNFQIIDGDAREVLPEIVRTLKNYTRYKIVGNIPYYLTGRLLRIFQELKNPPKSIVLTLQKEVAERIAAQAPKMNKLSAIINLWAEPKILFHLKPCDFYPAPKVSSSVIKLEVLPQWNKQGIPRGKPLKKRLKNEELIIQLIKIGSHQPRKTLLNNLSRIFPKNNLKNAFYELNLGDKTRPDDLNRDLWIKLAKALHHF